MEKLKKTMTNIISNNYKKQRRQQNYKKKQYELNKRRTLISKQNKSIKEIKQNEREQKKENLIDEDIDLGRYFELASSSKKYVNSLKLHELKNEILLGYKCEFELNGSMVIGPVEHKTNIRLKNMDHFEHYINAIDNDYDSEDVTFGGYVYKLNTFQFNRKHRSQYGRGTIFKQDIVEYTGNECYIPTSGNCFIKCINSFTKKFIQKNF